MPLTRSFHFAGFELDVPERRLRRDSEEIALQPRVYDVLLYLVERPQRVVPKDELLEAVWPDTFVTENALSRCIWQIRRALGDDAKSPAFLRTVPRVGYQFVAPLAEVPEASAEPARRSIAVLPFRSMTGETDDGLGLGMAETLITRLSRTQALLVRPLRATQRYAMGGQSPVEAGAEQQAELVVDGGIQQAEGQLRVSARLIRVDDGRALWADQFDRPVDEVFAIQDAICARIVEALEMALTGSERRQIAKRHTSSAEAYRNYLLGRLHLGKHTPAAAERAIDYFEVAIDLDPTYALAWAGLAEALVSRATVGADSRAYYERGRRAATRARTLDGELVDPLRCLAMLAWQHDWEWGEADRLFRQAIELDPSDSESRIAYSDYCCWVRRGEEGETQAREALAIDPVSPMVNALLAQALHMQGRDSDALTQAERTLEIDPSFAFARFFAGLAAVHCGREEEGIRNLETAVEISGRPDFAGALGWAYAHLGRSESARSILAEMRGRSASERVPPIVLATLHMALGEHDAAFEELERCLDERSWHVLLPYAEPIYADLRADSRARGLFSRLGLPAV